MHTSQGETIIEMLCTVNTRLDQLEKRVYDGDRKRNPRQQSDPSTNRP